MDKSAIIIIHFNGEEDTRECLKSILINHANHKNLHIILVINSFLEKEAIQRQNQFAQSLKRDYPQIYIIENEGNSGFTRGNNLAIKTALGLGCEYLMLLNNDTVVSLELLEKLIAFSKTDPRIGLISPKIYFAPGFEYHKNRYQSSEKGKVIWYAGGVMDRDNVYAGHRGVDEVDNGQFDRVTDTDFATGCCMLIPKKTIDKVGLLDEKYFLYYEDIDYSERVRKAGMKIIYYPKAFLWHKNASSSGKPGSNLHIYYQNRNRLYFGFKYSSGRTKKSLFFDSLKLAFRGGVYPRSIADYYLGKMGEAKL